MRMKILLFIVFLFSSTGFSEKASALSCAQFTPDMIVETIKSNKDLIVIMGSLTMDERFTAIRDQKLSDSHGIFNSLKGIIKGTDFRTDWPFEHEVDLNQYCISVWCGSVQPVSNAIFLLDQNINGYSMPLHACGGRVFSGFSDEHVQDIKKCFQSGECGSDDLKEEKKKVKNNE